MFLEKSFVSEVLFMKLEQRASKAEHTNIN